MQTLHNCRLSNVTITSEIKQYVFSTTVQSDDNSNTFSSGVGRHLGAA